MKFRELATPANLACAAFYALLLLAVALTDFSGLRLPMLLLIIPLAIFLADLLSGVVHIFFDYYPVNREAGFYEMFAWQGNRGTPAYKALTARVYSHPKCSILDKTSYSFKTHHIKPRAMNQKSYASHMLETVPAAILLELVAMLLPAEAALTLLITAFLAAHVQFVHACIHDTPRSVYWKKVVHRLQKMHIIYSLEAHMQHHRHGVSNFCLITGWADFVLNPAFRVLVKLKVIDTANWVSLATLRLPDGKPADY